MHTILCTYLVVCMYNTHDVDSIYILYSVHTGEFTIATQSKLSANDGVANDMWQVGGVLAGGLTVRGLSGRYFCKLLAQPYLCAWHLCAIITDNQSSIFI